MYPRSRVVIYGALLMATPMMIFGCAPEAGAIGPTTLRADKLYKLNERETGEFLRLVHGEEPDFFKRVVHIARKNIGQPYRLSLLGEFPFELHDPDPLYCLSASDCVTFVEQTYAMALGADWSAFFGGLQRLRYKESEIGLVTRNHFTEADWNVNNRWLFEDITTALAAGGQRSYVLRIDRAAFLAKFGVKVSTPVQEWKDSYIPREKIPGVTSSLMDADVIEIVRGPAGGPYVGHMGIVAHGSDSGVTMIHSTKPAVREEGLPAYLERRTEVLGIKVLRARPGLVESAKGDARKPVHP